MTRRGSRLNYSCIGFISKIIFAYEATSQCFFSVFRYAGHVRVYKSWQPTAPVCHIKSPGNGDPADDVLALLILGIDTSDPKTIRIANWNSETGWTDVDSYPIGTTLTAIFAWDKANH
jgi:hypothetical protein